MHKVLSVCLHVSIKRPRHQPKVGLPTEKDGSAGLSVEEEGSVSSSDNGKSEEEGTSKEE